MTEINANEIYDAVVIGLGPSGMMAVWNMKNNGKKVLGIDRGKAYNKRIRSIPLDVGGGFGGAGLFSDGKLSFYPAASKIWKNLDTATLKKSYEIMKSQFDKVNYDIPKWQDEWVLQDYVIKDNIKRNLVQYLTPATCVKFVNNIYTDIKDNIILEKMVEKIEYIKKDLFCVYYDQNKCAKARSIVLATGKLGNALLSKIDNVSILTKFRAEGGIRIETNNENFIPYDLPELDYKYIEKLENGVEFRTFCCCLDGKVLESQYCSKKSYNGTITSHPTGRSNVGLIIRSEEKQNENTKDLMNFLKKETFLFKLDEKVKASEFGKNIDHIINDKVLCAIKQKDTSHHTIIYGPEIEYCGEYPIFEWKSLKVDNYPIWIIGDLSAQYRGIIAALLSGLYASVILSKSGK